MTYPVWAGAIIRVVAGCPTRQSPPLCVMGMVNVAFEGCLTYPAPLGVNLYDNRFDLLGYVRGYGVCWEVRGPTEGTLG